MNPNDELQGASADPEPVVTMSPDAEAEQLAVADEASAAGQTAPDTGSDEPIRWQAKEHVELYKSPLWYLLFGVITLGLIALAIFVIKSWTFAVLVLVMAAALMVYIQRPARTMTYALSRKGLYVNDVLYSFGEFRGFGVVKDVEQYSIQLLPTKRFRPAVVVYFPEETGENIVDMLASRLPMHEMKLDLFDRIARKLRF